jgi:hypothetical protein
MMDWTESSGFSNSWRAACARCVHREIKENPTTTNVSRLSWTRCGVIGGQVFERRVEGLAANCRSRTLRGLNSRWGNYGTIACGGRKAAIEPGHAQALSGDGDREKASVESHAVEGRCLQAIGGEPYATGFASRPAGARRGFAARRQDTRGLVASPLVSCHLAVRRGRDLSYVFISASPALIKAKHYTRTSEPATLR